MKDDVKKLSQLVDSYDKEIANTKATLEALELIRDLVAEQLATLQINDGISEIAAMH